MSLFETKAGLILKILAKPNSPKFKIVVQTDEYVVYCTETPVRGNVNKEIVKAFSKLLHARTSIISGSTSKHKRLLVKGIEKVEAEQILAENNLFMSPAI